MALSSSDNNRESLLNTELLKLLEQLPSHKHGKWLERALAVLTRIGPQELDRLDWKILTAFLEDLEQGFQVFNPYRHTRKITMFGSARVPEDSPEYAIAAEFARCVTSSGFMVLTGGGGGIMQAGNEGAGRDNSFGLNVRLPFEQGANPFIEGDEKLIIFRYFFTRKLFLLRESDAIALFPGGFGTQDEAFESLTLCQTGKYGPVPIVLIDHPGDDYWRSWHNYISEELVGRGLVGVEDTSLYTITDDIQVACATIQNFYRIYHSSRYVGSQFVIRLNSELTNSQVEELNDLFHDILVEGRIEKTSAFPEELGDETAHLPRLVFEFNPRSRGRLYQMIDHLNNFGQSSEETEHPERK